jgi:hypothetical protein
MTIASDFSYVLPIHRSQPESDGELASYLSWLSDHAQVIVVDASPPEVYETHCDWQCDVRIPPAPNLKVLNGKVWGVLTGLEHASNERVIVADDDVRYDLQGLFGVISMLEVADVVRPQNYFHPLPWHAHWDSARILLNRMTGGDWPGTLGLRKSRLGPGYRRDCLFENLQMVRSVVASGGREVLADHVYVRRLPPTTRHFLSQRVRQAYDEWARPARLAIQLSLLPILFVLGVRRPHLLPFIAGATALLAELGRRRAGGRIYFSIVSALMAPLWLSERAVCAWLAVGARLLLGGVPYHGVTIREPASSVRELAATQLELRAGHD